VDTHLTQDFTLPASLTRSDRSIFAAGSDSATTHSEPLGEDRGWRAADVEQSYQHDDMYDDGLVHSHGWAVSDR